jgi:hypothetical protein
MTVLHLFAAQWLGNQRNWCYSSSFRNARWKPYCMVHMAEIRVAHHLVLLLLDMATSRFSRNKCFSAWDRKLLKKHFSARFQVSLLEVRLPLTSEFYCNVAYFYLSNSAYVVSDESGPYRQHFGVVMDRWLSDIPLWLRWHLNHIDVLILL